MNQNSVNGSESFWSSNAEAPASGHHVASTGSCIYIVHCSTQSLYSLWSEDQLMVVAVPSILHHSMRSWWCTSVHPVKISNYIPSHCR